MSLWLLCSHRHDKFCKDLKNVFSRCTFHRCHNWRLWRDLSRLHVSKELTHIFQLFWCFHNESHETAAAAVALGMRLKPFQNDLRIFIVINEFMAAWDYSNRHDSLYLNIDLTEQSSRNSNRKGMNFNTVRISEKTSQELDGINLFRNWNGSAVVLGKRKWNRNNWRKSHSSKTGGRTLRCWTKQLDSLQCVPAFWSLWSWICATYKL